MALGNRRYRIAIGLAQDPHYLLFRELRLLHPASSRRPVSQLIDGPKTQGQVKLPFIRNRRAYGHASFAPDDVYRSRRQRRNHSMFGKDPVTLTEAYPKTVLRAKRLRSALTGRIHFFNGQKSRVRVFRAIDGAVSFENYIETGTFLGMTTDFLARTATSHAARVYSCELDDRHFAIANRTVGDLPNVHLHHANSVDFLRSLSSKVCEATNFVYLDAHWNDYLPLRDELAILKDWPKTVVLIDDFKVPSDPRFGWDKYDEDREICLEHIAGTFGDHAIYFPSYPAADEGTAHPRGYAVIAMSAPLQNVLDQILLLKRH
jgi:predicted O-methyltransferase YrrM